MPVIDPSPYRPPLLLKNPHLQTVLPSLLRNVRGVDYKRHRIDTPDGDFVDVDFSQIGASRAAVLCHGLESSASESYIRGMVRAFNRRGWDASVLNFRGCSGEENRLARSYHSDATEDLDTLVSYLETNSTYETLAFVGFSLGGNLVLKYVGESAEKLKPSIVAAAAVSVPCDLASSAACMSQISNRFYMRRFARKLREKILSKAKRFPDEINFPSLRAATTFYQIDEHYTGPIHGFKGAHDYWTRCSCRQFTPRIRIPTLLISARDDPFLSKACFPYQEAVENPNFTLEVTDSGGHVGFIALNGSGEYWHESRIADFASAVAATHPRNSSS